MSGARHRGAVASRARSAPRRPKFLAPECRLTHHTNPTTKAPIGSGFPGRPIGRRSNRARNSTGRNRWPQPLKTTPAHAPCRPAKIPGYTIKKPARLGRDGDGLPGRSGVPRPAGRAQAPERSRNRPSSPSAFSRKDESSPPSVTETSSRCTTSGSSTSASTSRWSTSRAGISSSARKQGMSPT